VGRRRQLVSGREWQTWLGSDAGPGQLPMDSQVARVVVSGVEALKCIHKLPTVDGIAQFNTV
jgi:hypothetical protein